MGNLDRESKLLGILLLMSIMFGILSSVPALERSGYLNVLASMSNHVYLASFFQICMAMTYLGIISVIDPIFKMYNDKLAVMCYSVRIVSVSLLFFSVIFLLYLLSMSNLHVSNLNSKLIGLDISAELIRMGRDWINHILVIFTWTMGGSMMYMFFYKTGIVPKWISVLGLVGCSLTLIITTALLFNQIEIVSIQYLVMNIPLAVTEVILAVFLFKNGFSRLDTPLV